MIYLLDLLGTVVFAVSGALAASRKNMDIFGFCVLALMPAVGGGTLRDLLIGRQPVFWIEDTSYILAALGVAVLFFFGAHRIKSRYNLLVWMDAMGLALFGVLGCGIALETGTGSLVAVLMGVVTAVTGGMIRDIICNEIPLILSREIYATAAFVSGITYITCIALGLNPVWSTVAGVVLGFAVRAAGIITDFSLPSFERQIGRKPSGKK